MNKPIVTCSVLTAFLLCFAQDLCEMLFTSQVMDRFVVVTLGSMKDELATIEVKKVEGVGAPLRVVKYMQDDTLLLLDICGAPLVSPATHLPIADAHVEPIRAAIAMPYFVAPQLQKQLQERWLQTNCQPAGAGQEGWVLKDFAELRDPRLKNKFVIDYYSALSVNQLKVACLQFNIDRLLADEEGALLSDSATISQALADRLELVPLGATEAMPPDMSLTFVFLDDDADGARLRTLRAKWKAAMSKAEQPASKRQKTAGSSAEASAAASSHSRSSSRKRKDATSGSSAQQSTQQEPEEGVSPRRGAKASRQF
jgi:hypothetical protein